MASSESYFSDALIKPKVPTISCFMDNISRLITLFPCNRLDDFPIHLGDQAAQSLHACWTGLWHPSLIHRAGSVPSWHDATRTVSNEEEADALEKASLDTYYNTDDYEDDEDYQDEVDFHFDAREFTERWKDTLVTIPRHARESVCNGFSDAAGRAGATVVECSNRQELLQQLKIDSSALGTYPETFFSLGYVRLQIEMMTRQLRYSSELDVLRFDQAVLDAAAAVFQNDHEAADKHLTLAFDVLLEERNQYYPVGAELIDIVLTHPGTSIDSLKAELEQTHPRSLLVTGGFLKKLQQTAPDVLNQILQQQESGSLSLIGGEENELPLSLLSVESNLDQIRTGCKTFEDVAGYSPEVYMRRQTGLSPLTPAILESLGFGGAMHFSLDGGVFPSSSSNSICWNGIDGSSIMALCEKPGNAANTRALLDAAIRIGSELDSVHTASLLFARWPGKSSEAFEDLKNSTPFGAPLGKFVTANEHFREAHDPGYGESFEPDEYENKWVENATRSTIGSPRPISNSVTYWKRWYRTFSIRSLLCSLAITHQDNKPKYDNTKISELLQRADSLQTEIANDTLDWSHSQNPSIDSQIGELQTAATQLATGSGCSVFNPAPFKSVALVKTSGETGDNKGLNFSSTEKFRFGSSSLTGSGTDFVVQQSGMRAATMPQTSPSSSTSLSKNPFVDSDNLLRNEHFEVAIDTTTGGIKRVGFYETRGALFGQQVAARIRDGNQTRLSKMRRRDTKAIRHSAIRSTVETTGTLTDGDVELATFCQQVTVSRGRQLIDIRLQIDPTEHGTAMLESGGWFCIRTAWGNDAASLACDSLGSTQPIRKPNIEATHFVEVIDTDQRFGLLCNGLPVHRRTERSKLETILIRGNEQQRAFEFAYVINSPSIMQQAVSEMLPTILVDTAELDGIHIANRNIIVTAMEPVFSDDFRCTGLRLRIQETAGQATSVKIWSRRKIEQLEKEDFQGESSGLTIEGSTESAGSYWLSTMDCSGFGFFQVLLKFDPDSN